MDSIRPLVKLFETRGKYYLFDTNKNSILNINKEQYKAFEKYMETGDRSYINSQEIDTFIQDGFLSNNRVREIVSPYDELLGHYLENNVEMLTLQLTQQCNFRCEYCVYSGSYTNRTHSSKRMELSTALKTIDFCISHSKNNKRLCIDFYGGEPLLEFDLLKTCVEYAKEKGEGKEIDFYVTTNGYYLNDEILDFLYKHRVMLTISLDGPEEIHDKHRRLALNNKGTYKKVYENIATLRKKYKDYISLVSFSTVVDKTNDFETIDNFFKNDEIAERINIIAAPITDTNCKVSLDTSDKFYTQREYEVFRELYYSIKKRKKKTGSAIVSQTYSEIATLSKRLTSKAGLPEKAHPSGPCIAGTKRLFVSVDGYFYPCEKCSESSELMKIGHIDTGFDIEKVRELMNIGKVNDNACKNCWAFSYCFMCAAIIDSSEGKFSIESKKQVCKEIKESTEEQLKNYCVLKEFGHEFNDENKERYLLDN